MKTRYIVLGILLSAALSLSARIYTTGEDIYVNVKQSDAVGDWSKDGAKIFFYLWQSTSTTTNLWLEASHVPGGNESIVKAYKVTIPSTAAGWYDRVIIVRGTAAGWSTATKWNQTSDIDIPDNSDCNCNMLNIFDPSESNKWSIYSPSAEGIGTVAAGETADEIHVCAAAAGDPISLRPKLNSTKTGYLYDDVIAHAWYYSMDGISWSAASTFAGTARDEEFYLDKDLFATLPNPIPAGGVYYFLYSTIPAGRHLVHVLPDAEGCVLDCSITSFETAISAVNADNNTFTLDGMVAFGEPDGQLVIECQGKSVTISSPRSPQSFSLPLVPAATTNGVQYTATARFTGNTSCETSIVFDVPNAKQALETVTIDTLTGDPLTLIPSDADPANDYVWIVNGVENKKADGQPQNYAVPAFSTAGTQTYIYKEFYPISGSMDDMMSNGNYESTTGYGTYGAVSTISDYNYWGYFDEAAGYSFYSDTLAGGRNPNKLKENGFAVVKNAHCFSSSYATVEAHEGSNFALFDAATGAAGGNKKAWYANTTNNPNLKLKKGTTYVLSFWAANINNYGEMDNAARFQFRIEYNGHTWNSAVLDLSKPEFRNNIWHQHSETFYADEDCDEVTISVVNLNTNTLHIGNDFALDDIQFHPISSVSRVVKSQQQFVVTAHEPTVDVFTATVQPVACGGTDYTVAMHVEYQNPNGRLIIKDNTTGAEYPYTLPAVAYDTPAALNDNIVITTNEPTHEWEAYFEDWTTAKKTATTVIPGFPSIEVKNFVFSAPGCTDLTSTLTFDIAYTYQQGTLRYWVDGLPAQTAAYSVADKTEQQLVGLNFAGIPADGKAHTLHVLFDGANSCAKDSLTVVPYSPVISNVAVSGVPATVTCPTQEYPATVTITTPYDATGHEFTVRYDDGGAQSLTIAATGTTTTAVLTLHDIGGAAQYITVAYTDAPACAIQSTDALTPPTRISCDKDEATICEGETYTWKGMTYSRPVGIDTITNPANVYDTLLLTVNATPRISIGTVAMTCDNAGEVRIPVTVTHGAPDSYDIELDGVHYAGMADGTDIVFTPTAMESGEYTANITAGEGQCETTASFRFTIALSGQMYSKWTDVLFIDNHDHSYTGYQWYADGSAIANENQQYLYRPEGMSGQPTLFHCRLTTTDGKTLYTCPMTFDEVPRSAETTPETAPAQVIRTYQVGPHVQIVQTIEGERIQTRKIIIHE